MRADEEAVFDVRLSRRPEDYAASLLRATGTDVLLLDDGFPAPGDGFGWQVMGELAQCRVQPVLRIESHSRPEIDGHGARHGFAALKTIAAYRGGLRLDGGHPLWRVLDNEATGDPLPVQVHCGFETATCCFRSPIRAG